MPVIRPGLVALVWRLQWRCQVKSLCLPVHRRRCASTANLVCGLVWLWFLALGLDTGNAQLQRVANPTLAMPATPPVFGYSVTNAFGALNFLDPVCIASPPGETNRLFVVEHVGNIAVITNLAAPTRSVFLSISNKVTYSDEGGLLAMEFHPGFATNGYFYVWYYGLDTTSVGTGAHDILAQYQVSPPSANSASAATEIKLIRQYDEANNHNGGDLHFGPDGYLYVSLGDEGGSNSQYNNDQRIDKDFFAGLLRIDVDKRPGSLPPNPHPAATTNYAVPADNPFIGVTNFNGVAVNAINVRTEFWAVGLRNPWRFNFDPVTGRLYLGDVGEDVQEEVNLITKGGNYGWAYREGLTNGAKITPGGFTSTPPVLTYTHGFATNQGFCIIGGLVYQGNNLSQLADAYVFGDNVSGNIWSLRYDGTNVTEWRRLGSAVGLSTFGADPRNGDILLATRDVEGGSNIVQPLKRLVYSTNFTGQPLPPTLADTGAFTNLTTLTPAPGVVAYGVNHPFWSDNAVKQRWFSLPNTNLTIGFNATDNWSFPASSVWIKHFDLQLTNGAPAQRLETRLLVKNTTGVYGVTYRWGNSLTNATLVPEGGLDETFVIDEGGGVVRTQSWHYPGRQECLACHTALGGHALSFNTAQLNRTNTFSGFVTNQIQALSDAGYFSSPVTNLASLPALAAVTDSTADTELRVRSYLAANCAQCHQPGGLALSWWDARFTTPTTQAGLINGALVNNFGNTNNAVIKPGSLINSVLWSRVANLGAGHMPPLATSVINNSAVQLLSDWITNDLAYPILTLTPTALNLSAVVGNNPAPRVLGITNGGSGLLNWTVAADAAAPAWLTVSPTNGLGNGPVSVAVISSNLSVGSYVKAITVIAPGATNSPQMLTVTLTITASNQPPLALDDNYTVAAGAVLSAGAPGVLSNDSDPDGSSLVAVLVSGPGHGTLNLDTNGSFLYTPTPGYSGADSFTYKTTDGFADSLVATVSLTVTPPPPVLAISPTTLNFTVTQGDNPANQLFTITNSGGGTLNWTATPDATAPAWLACTPANGTGNSTITVAVASASLTPGNYTKSITVSAAGATNSPQTVTVNLSVAAGNGTNHLDFNYTNRVALLAAGWDFLARTTNGASRNTEQTAGIVVDYNQTTHPGVVRIPADVGDLWLDVNTSRNTLFRDVPTNWTSLRLKFSFAPTQNYQQAGLIVYQNDDTYVQLTRMYNGGQRVSFVRESGGSAAVLQSAILTTTTNLHFRLDRDPAAGLISGFYSLNNTNWTAVGSGVVQTINNPRLGIFVGASPGGQPNADLAWVEVIAPYTPPVNPSLTVTPTVCNFSKTYGTIPTAQSFGITNSGGGTLNWTAGTDAAAPGWLTVNPASGTGNAAVSVLITNVNLNAGTYLKTITVTAAGATNSPRSVTVNLTVTRANPLIATKPNAAAITYGQTLSATILSGGSATNAAGVTVPGTFAFTAPAASPNAGIALQSVTFTPTDTTNYNAVTTTVSVTVNPAPPLIAAKPSAAAITYGQALSAAVLSGGAATNAAGVAVPGTFVFTAPATSPNAGIALQNVTFIPADTTNYTTVVTTVSVTVNPAVPLIAAKPSATAITYGQALSAAILSGGSATNAAGVAVPGAFAFTAPATSPNAGIALQSVTFMPTDTTNYTSASATVSVTVNPAPPLIAAKPSATAITYGQALSAAVLTGGAATNAAGVTVPGAFAFITPATSPTAGTALQSVTFTPLDPTNYTTAVTTVSVTVNPALLMITAHDAGKVYDGLPYSGGGGVVYAGFVNAETEAVLTGSLNYGGTAQGALHAGSYSIAPSGLTATNYVISYQAGTLTVHPRGVTVTAEAQTKVYGSADPELSYHVSPALIGGDGFSGALSRAPGENVGGYAIGQGTLSLSTNYSLTFVGTNLIITPASLTITAHNASKVYGQTMSFVGTEFTPDGLLGGGLVTGVSLSSDGMMNTAAAGVYPINISAATGSGLENYTLQYVPGTLTVTAAVLTVTAENQTRSYGAVNPEFTVIYSGFVNGESLTNSDVAGAPELGTLANASSAVGVYEITNRLGSLTATNYSFQLSNGSLTITAALLTIVAYDASKVYDGLPYGGGNGVTYAGFVNAETEAVLAGSLNYGGTAQGALHAGSYSIAPSGLTATNYAISYQAGTLTVHPRGVTVTAEAQTKVYGSADPGLSYHVSPALIGGDDFSGVLIRVPGESVGEYAIELGTLSLNTNYHLTYVGTNLTITSAPLTITALNVSKEYDGLPYGGGNGVTYEGFVNAETEAVLAGRLNYSGTAQGALHAGSYSIVPSGLTATNYAINYQDGTLTVQPLAVTVMAEAQSKVYGSVDPELSYYVNPALIGEDSFSGTLIRAPGESVGDYAIAQGSLSLGPDYNLTFAGTNFTITPAFLTITAHGASKVYDGLPYSGGDGVSYHGFVNDENETALAGSLSYGGTAQGAINTGDYSILPSGFTASNYTINYQGNTLTILPLEVTVTAAAQSKVYGSADPELSYYASPGLVSGDNFSGALTRAPGESVGNYAIGQGALTLNTNYSLNFIGADLTIAPAPLTITARAASKVYGQTVSFAGTEFSSDDLLGGDMVTSVSLSSDGAPSVAATGDYPIIASNAAGSGLDNYMIHYLPGTLTVTAPTPVLIHPPVMLGDNTVKLTFAGGDSGVSYRVEVSPDLNATNWSTLITNLTGTNGLPTLIDWDATNHAHRFYRTVTP